MRNLKSISLVLLMILIVVPMVSAFSFDNWQFKQSVTFDGRQVNGNSLLERYKPIEIKNQFGLGKTLFEGYLSQHDDVCGIDCQSTMQIKLNQDGILIDDVDFYTIKIDGRRVKQDIRSYQFYYNNVPYNLGDEVKAGTYEVRLEGQKSPKRSVDWIIETNGQTLESWATWGNISSGDDAEVVLNSPVDYYNSSVLEVIFNCSVNVTGGAAIMNISLWENSSGTWEVNEDRIFIVAWNNGSIHTTNDPEGVTNPGNAFDENDVTYAEKTDVVVTTASLGKIFNESFIRNIKLKASTLTSGGLGTRYSEIVLQTYNGSEWSIVATLKSGAAASYDYDDTYFLNVSTKGIRLRSNSTYGADSNQVLKFYTIEYESNESVIYSTQAFEKNLTGSADWTCSASDSDGDIGFGENYTISLLFGTVAEYYNTSTTETATEGFRINITSDGTQTVLANLSYNGTIYPATKVGNNSEMEFYKDFGSLPAISTPTATNHSFFWEVYYGTQNINTTANNQTVERIYLDLCNSTLTTSYINFTFEDEETTIATNATIDTSTWYYYLGDGTVNKSLLYSTTTANESYGFCFMPTDETMKNTIELQYSDTGYPQRRWTSTTALTNTTTNQKLYMLASADGTYSVYQVQTSTGSGISGVTVQAERQFASIWTLVEEGETDSAGGFTAWLNPDYDHRLTFTKSGYTSVQVTIRPSSSTYTVVMGIGEEEATYNSSMEGLSWKIYPNLGKILLPNTTQTFLFNITSNLSNIVSCKMEVVNNNSISLGTTTGCTSQGGNLSLAIPLGTNRSVRAIYSVDIGEGYFILDADAYWIVMTTDIPERGTIVSFFKYARNLNEFGNDANRQEFSRVVLFFLILMITMASISKTTGWDLATMGGSIVFISFIVWFASYGGFLTLSYTGVNGWMDQYVVALITSLFAGGYALNKIGRES